jgi:ribosomal protein S4E
MKIGDLVMVDFKIGNWVCVTRGDNAGIIGQIYFVGKIDCAVIVFKKEELPWFRREDLRHLTTQEMAHIYAEEICNGV